MSVRVGVLALQGAVEPHKPHIEACGVGYLPVKTPEDFERADGFILPGGESTTMLRLIKNFNLKEKLLQQFVHKPAWGVCAGAILIAKNVANPVQESFNLIDIDICRNGYGRQLDSHHDQINGYPVSFIRAPLIERTGEGVEIIVSQKKSPVWVQQGRVMATTFHPELTLDFPSPMHREFVDMVKKKIS